MAVDHSVWTRRTHPGNGPETTAFRALRVFGPCSCSTQPPRSGHGRHPVLPGPRAGTGDGPRRSSRRHPLRGMPGVGPSRSASPAAPPAPGAWLLVEVDGSPNSHHGLVWALREAARRGATVVAVTVLDAPAGDPLDGSSRVLVGTSSPPTTAWRPRCCGRSPRPASTAAPAPRARPAGLRGPRRRHPRCRPRRRRPQGESLPPGRAPPAPRRLARGA